MKKLVLCGAALMLAVSVIAQPPGNGNGNGNGNGLGNGNGNGNNGNGLGNGGSNGGGNNGGGNGGNNGGSFVAAEWSPSSAENQDVATINLSTTTPDWIDINPDGPTTLANVNVYSLTNNTNGFNILDDGWDLGSLAMAISSSREAQVTIAATNMTSTTTSDVIAANRLSATITKNTANTTSHINVNHGDWGVATPFQTINGNNLSTSAQTCFGSTGTLAPSGTAGGGHNIQFTAAFSLYKGLNHTQADFYSDNVNGGTYTNTITLTATLEN